MKSALTGIITFIRTIQSMLPSVKIRQYCRRALELGIVEICFTTHVELDPVRKEKDNFALLNGERIPVLNPCGLTVILRKSPGHRESSNLPTLK